MVFFFFGPGLSFILLQRGVSVQWFPSRGLVAQTHLLGREAPTWLWKKVGSAPDSALCPLTRTRAPTWPMGPGVRSWPPMLQGSPASWRVSGWEASFGQVRQAGPLLTASALAKYIVLIECCFFI